MTLPDSADARTPNAELAHRVLDHIKADPESWDQASWYRKTHCGTVGCFAGWAVMLSGLKIEGPVYPVVVAEGHPLDDVYVPVAAAQLLGLADDADDAEGLELFHEGNTLADLEEMVADLFGPRPEPLP